MNLRQGWLAPIELAVPLNFERQIACRAFTIGSPVRSPVQAWVPNVSVSCFANAQRPASNCRMDRRMRTRNAGASWSEPDERHWCCSRDGGRAVA